MSRPRTSYLRACKLLALVAVGVAATLASAGCRTRGSVVRGQAFRLADRARRPHAHTGGRPVLDRRRVHRRRSEPVAEHLLGRAGAPMHGTLTEQSPGSPTFTYTPNNRLRRHRLLHHHSAEQPRPDDLLPTGPGHVPRGRPPARLHGLDRRSGAARRFGVGSVHLHGRRRRRARRVDRRAAGTRLGHDRRDEPDQRSRHLQPLPRRRAGPRRSRSRRPRRAIPRCGRTSPRSRSPSRTRRRPARRRP